MKNFFYVDHVSHDLRLAHIPRDSVQHENVDIRFKLVGFDCCVDRHLPKFDRNVVRNELAFARVFQKCLAKRCAGIDRTKYVATRAMKIARNGSERFPLSAFAAARCAEQNECAVFHERVRLYRTRGQSGRELFRRNRIDIDPTPATIESHAAVNQCEDSVIPAEADVFSRQKFCPALATNDVAGNNHLAAESLDSEPFADAVPTVFNAALSFFMSHLKKLSC